MANINKNIIMQAGAAVANATNKAAGLSAATPEPGSIISAIQLVNGGRTIGPDAFAHFTESVRNKLLTLLVSMEPIQDLHGYANPWPAGGNVNKCAFPDVDFTLKNVRYYTENGILHMSGTSTGETSSNNTAFYALSVHLSAGTYYFSRFTYPNAAYLLDSNGNVLVSNNGAFTLNAEETVHVGFYVYNRTFNGEAIPLSIIEGSSAPSSYTPTSNICPISGRTGANAYVSPTPNVADATTYAADWTTLAGTVYAGSADIVTGDIKAAPYYASYNGETLVGPWVSSMDEYDPEGTPTTGAQVVDLGGTMTDYHITGQDIITLVGNNYIWSDSGDVTITE